MLFTAMALASALAIKAQEPADPAELRFRRVYAPADRISDWPTGEGKYLPLESDEFERLLSLARSGPPDRQGSFTTRTVAAEYQAELSGEQLLIGRATLEITHSGQSAGMLSLEPCNAAISKTAWLISGQDDKTETKNPLLGFGRDGRLQVLVEQSGKFSFDWSMSGRRDAGGAMVFSCEFPACPVSVLRLDLPGNLTPASDKGVVSGGKESVEGRRRWRIDLGGNCRFHLYIAAAGAANARPPLALLGESSVYEFSLRGIDLSAQWKIRTHDEPLEKIVVLLDPGLQLATALLGETALNWTIEPLPGDAGSRAVLSLGEPIKDAERLLRLGALARLTLDRPCRLPRMKPEGLFWQEGGITLIVPDPLLVERLTPIDCSQTAVGPLAEPRVGESLQFQNFSADATIEIELARRDPDARPVPGAAVKPGAGQTTARATADLFEDSAGPSALEIALQPRGPAFSAAVLGMLACLLLVGIRIQFKNSVPPTTPHQAASDRLPPPGSKSLGLADRTGAILLIAAASMFFARDVRAEEAAEKPRTAALSEYRVFIPIDKEKKPAGDKVYLPEKFYIELYRRAAAAKQEPQGWLLGSAVYRGTLEREPATGRTACEAINARFDLKVFGRMVQVRIPFRRENARLIPDRAALDGRPILPQWEADGCVLSFEVQEPGDYRLELGFWPAPREFGASGGFEMSIPRLAQSRLELSLPAEIPGIEAASAIGAIVLETDPPRLSAQLGPSNRLAVHWPETPAKGAGETGIEADQLTWMKVKPGSVVVEVRFKFHLPENQVRRLQLAADPRLRLLPLQGKDQPGVQIRSDGAKQQIITLQWNRPLSKETALDLSFLLTGASGVGKFRLPRIEPLDAQKIKRWLAVSVDPILEYESQGSPGLEAAATAELLKNWDFPDPPPLLAYRLESDKADWSLSIRPREPETSAQQTLALSYGRNNVEAHFEAQLTVASGYVFQYQLSAPAAMKVLKASVRKEGAELAARWSQDPGGTISIFLTGPAEGKQQISLEGIIPLENGENTPLPEVRLMHCRLESTTVEVLRRDN
jgi:hypothetical protein